METRQTCRVILNPLSHFLTTQRGFQFGCHPMCSLHQAGTRCCRHWSKKSPFPSPSPLLPQITQQGETQTPNTTSSFLWLSRRGCQGGRKAKAPQHLGILLMASLSTQGCPTSHPWDRKQLPTHVWLTQKGPQPELEHRSPCTIKSNTQRCPSIPYLSQESCPFMSGRSVQERRRAVQRTGTEQAPVLNENTSCHVEAHVRSAHSSPSCRDLIKLRRSCCSRLAHRPQPAVLFHVGVR